MEKRLRWSEICANHPDRWVFLLDPIFNEDNEILSGIVKVANNELSQVTIKAKDLRAQPHAFRYTGRIHPQVGVAKWNVNERI